MIAELRLEATLGETKKRDKGLNFTSRREAGSARKGHNSSVIPARRPAGKLPTPGRDDLDLTVEQIQEKTGLTGRESNQTFVIPLSAKMRLYVCVLTASGPRQGK